MPLPLPHLDDRDFDQLVEEARNTLPLSAPAWTDHNASDPGITLLELFAYLTEIGLYRLDRIPPALYRTFLRLLGFPARPAQVAGTVLIFQQAATDVIGLASRTQVASSAGITFQTTTALDVVRAKLVSVVSSSKGELIDRMAANSALRPFAPLGDSPLIGDAIYLGFDRPLGLKGTLVRLHAFGEDASRDADAWQALAAEARAARRDIRAACPHQSLRCIGRFWRHYSVRLEWEYRDVSGEWMPLARATDRTRALSISGPVHFRAPQPSAHLAGGVAGHDTAYFIRARLASGEYDCAPQLRGIRINAVAARHAADVPDQSITNTVRRANRSFVLLHAPVVPRSTSLDVTLTDGSHEKWTEVADWDRSGPSARHYLLEPATGTLRFGDGRQGRVIQDRSAIQSVVVRYRAGGGPTGNIAAGSLDRIATAGADAALTVAQPIAARGGAVADTIEAAEGRAVRGLADARCAVTLADFERFALRVPGAAVARAHAIVNFHPTLACLPAAGCVTVVIVPPCVDRQRDPTPALCAEVERYLDRRRPLACELHVIGPQYTTVSVRARLYLTRDADRAASIERARMALEDFFHPLNGGPANNGWPIGRSVYRSEILALLASGPGVAWVSDLELRANAGINAACGNLDICAHGLVISGTHDISAAVSATQVTA